MHNLQMFIKIILILIFLVNCFSKDLPSNDESSTSKKIIVSRYDSESEIEVSHRDKVIWYKFNKNIFQECVDDPIPEIVPKRPIIEAFKRISSFSGISFKYLHKY